MSTPRSCKTDLFVAGAWIDPAQVQVIFADFQGNLPDSSRTRSPEALARSAVGLAKIAKLLDIPMLFTSAAQDGMDPTTMEALKPWSHDGNTYYRMTSGTFMDEKAAAAIDANDRPILLVAGFASEVVVMQTVLDGLAAGYRVYYVVDAIGSQTNRSEQAVFREIEQAGAIPTSVISLATRLAPDLSTSPGKEVLAIMLDTVTD